VTAIVWTRLDGVASLEHFILRERTLEGRIVAKTHGFAIASRYFIQCDESWMTRRVSVHVVRDTEATEIAMTVDAQQRWTVDGAHRPEFDGLADVDLSITPSTNTLPVHRLDLGVGESKAVTAVWLRFPSLEIVALEQRYTRIGELRYRYQSPNFAADVEVDESGLVVRYGDVWGRVE
jgi:hypothetical protein